MAGINRIGRVLVPVSDQDRAIVFYTESLGFTLLADVPYAGGERWVEVGPPGGGASIALAPPRGDFQPGRSTGVSLSSSDVRGTHAAWREQGVDVDAEVIGGEDGVPLLFFFRDRDGNQLFVAEER
jgi:catechol 2,3-dioxygenase-like lactoylglutathione lyase family enzyme